MELTREDLLKILENKLTDPNLTPFWQIALSLGFNIYDSSQWRFRRELLGASLTIARRKYAVTVYQRINGIDGACILFKGTQGRYQATIFPQYTR